VDPSGLLEGPTVIDGLRLPFRSIVKRQSSISTEVEIPFPLEQVSTYVRNRLQAERVQVGPSQTMFENATVLGANDKPLDITVRRMTNGTTMTILRRPLRRPPDTAPP
jgi:hypothetical protein